MEKNIFLVEDESIIREMYELALNRAGFKVNSAADGEEALSKLLSPVVQYDLILLDIMIPKLDGLHVLKKIREESSPVKSVPVFLLTNLGQDNLIKEAMNIGAQHYFIKSNIIPRQLIEEINKFLASR